MPMEKSNAPGNQAQPGREHTIGDDPNRAREMTYHCSQCGRPVDENAKHLNDGAVDGGIDGSNHEGMAVADDWPAQQAEQDAQAKVDKDKTHVGNTTTLK
jgi:hypothetical protein